MILSQHELIILTLFFSFFPFFMKRLSKINNNKNLGLDFIHWFVDIVSERCV